MTVRGLVVRRGRTQVYDGLDIDILRGRITGFLGPSGGGKTTLMRAIVGVQAIDRGEVTVLGEEAGSPGLRRRVAYATQMASVYDDLTVAQNLLYFARVLGAPTTDVDRVIAEVGLNEQRQQLTGSLSGGQRGRVSLAAAMLGSPDLLVLDEPTVGLDPVMRESLWEIFRGLSNRGATLIISSHVMDETLRCDEVVLIHDGCILAHTTPDELLRQTGALDPDTAFLRLVEGDGEVIPERTSALVAPRRAAS